MADKAAEAAQVIEDVLRDAELEWESPEPGSYVVKLPGTRKLSTTVSLIAGRHTLSLNAFVVRHPDENEGAVHRWLLERNLKLFGVSYAVDPLGDIYVTGKLPLAAVTPDGVTHAVQLEVALQEPAVDSRLCLLYTSPSPRD